MRRLKEFFKGMRLVKEIDGSSSGSNHEPSYGVSEIEKSPGAAKENNGSSGQSGICANVAGIIRGELSPKKISYESGNCYIAPLDIPESHFDPNVQSPLVLLEDGVWLSGGNSFHDEIRKTGGGLFSHWQSNIYFSSSDNSDPRINGKKYTYIFPATDSHEGSRALFEDDMVQDNKALKIINYIGTLGAGGAERQLSYHSLILKKMGYDIKVLTTYKCEGSHAHYKNILNSGGVSVKQAGFQHDGSEAGFNKAALKNMKTSLLSVVPASNYIRHWVAKLADELTVLRPDILHCWLDHSSIIGGIAGYVASVPKIILNSRNVNPTNFPYLDDPWLKGWYQTLAKSRRVVFMNNSHNGARDYENWLGMPRGSFTVILNGVDFDSVKAPPNDELEAFKRSATPNGGKLVGGIFRLSAEKRPFDFLDAVKRVLMRHPDVKAVIAGEGKMWEEMKLKIAEMGLDGHVTLLGRREDVFTIIKACDVILHTSEHEGTPNALLEAQYLGIPVVTTSAGGTPDCVNHGVTGFIHDIGDVDGLAGSVVALLENVDLRREMGSKGPGFITKRFALRRMVDETLDLYHGKVVAK